MKNLFKLLTLFIAIIASINSSFAFSPLKMEKYIKTSGLNDTATVAISIKDVNKDVVVYEQNQNKLLHPASTLKIFTTFQAMEILGYNYSFKTALYKDAENNLYIKLGADPLFTSSQLKSLFEIIKEEGHTSFKNLYIDDSIVDKKEFAPGWMWDDDINPYTPKVSAYNLDGNVVKVGMIQDEQGTVSTALKSNYPMSVISSIVSGAETDYLDINRYNWSNPEVVEISGNVKAPRDLTIPISSMRRYYIYNVEKLLEETKITIEGTSFSSKLLPENSIKLAEIQNSIENALPLVLQNSNNLAAESIYKIAAGVNYNATGTDEIAEYMFKNFYKVRGLDVSNIIVKDGCGVSRNNLLYASWMTNALTKIYESKNFPKFKEYMAQAGEGTLQNRLYDLRGEAWLKTGSLSNISAIAGYVQSQDGHTYAVAILTQNFIQDQRKIKEFEDELIKIIYSR